MNNTGLEPYCLSRNPFMLKNSSRNCCVDIFTITLKERMFLPNVWKVVFDNILINISFLII